MKQVDNYIKKNNLQFENPFKGNTCDRELMDMYFNSIGFVRKTEIVYGEYSCMAYVRRNEKRTIEYLIGWNNRFCETLVVGFVPVVLVETLNKKTGKRTIATGSSIYRKYKCLEHAILNNKYFY